MQRAAQLTMVGTLGGPAAVWLPVFPSAAGFGARPARLGQQPLLCGGVGRGSVGDRRYLRGRQLAAGERGAGAGQRRHLLGGLQLTARRPEGVAPLEGQVVGGGAVPVALSCPGLVDPPGQQRLRRGDEPRHGVERLPHRRRLTQRDRVRVEPPDQGTERDLLGLHLPEAGRLPDRRCEHTFMSTQGVRHRPSLPYRQRRSCPSGSSDPAGPGLAGWVGAARIELATIGLKGRCSAN
ncbi:hypothetical protein BH24ACT3_BH24ACT3_09170 [soil metagenome]